MITIIGAGVSGLSAGIYLQMNGYETSIYEQHYIPGGVCTGWYKNGYYIDGCIHWLMGTKEGTGYAGMWNELGVLEHTPILRKKTLMTIELSNGECFQITNDLAGFIRDLHKLSPQDTPFIYDLEKSLKAMSKADVYFEKPDDIASFLDKMKNILQLGPALKVYGKYAKITVKQLTATFHSPLLAEVIEDIIGMEDFAAISVFTTLSNFFTGNGGIPQGGSLAFAKRLAKRYEELGGRLFLNQPVERIIAEKGKASAIQLSDGTTVMSDRVISAADGHATYTRLLNSEYTSPTIKWFYQENQPFHPLIIVSFGASDKLEDIPGVISFPISPGIDVGGKRATRIKLRNHNYDPTLNQKKGATIQVNLFSDWSYWHELHQNKDLYEAKKAEIANEVLHAIEERYPSLRGRLVCIDVATPKTFFHFTSVWRGAFEGWLLTPGNIKTKLKKQVEGMENVYHIGQWTTPGGGVTIAAKDGRDIARIICHQDRKKFYPSKATKL